VIQQQEVQTHNDTPQIVYDQASAYQLGAQGSTYKPVLSNVLVILGIVVGVTILDVLLIYVIIVTISYIIYVLAAIPIAAIIFGIYAVNDRNLRVYQFANGLIRAKGKRLDVIRWDQVAFLIQNGGSKGSEWADAGSGVFHRNVDGLYSITVQRTDGVKFHFGGTLRHATQLIQTIQEAVTEVHLPQAVTTFNAGSSVTFGPFILNSQGLSKGGEVVPWNEIQSVNVKSDVLIIKRVGKAFFWASVKISKIPNALVFMYMVHYARTGRID
jgi:hypothetical protein